MGLAAAGHLPPSATQHALMSYMMNGNLPPAYHHMAPSGMPPGMGPVPPLNAFSWAVRSDASLPPDGKTRGAKRHVGHTCCRGSVLSQSASSGQQSCTCLCTEPRMPLHRATTRSLDVLSHTLHPESTP